MWREVPSHQLATLGFSQKQLLRLCDKSAAQYVRNQVNPPTVRLLTQAVQHQDSSTVPNETTRKRFLIWNKLEIYQHFNSASHHVASALVAKMVMHLQLVLYLYGSTFTVFHFQINPGLHEQ